MAVSPLCAQSGWFQPSALEKPDVRKALQSVDDRATDIVEEWIRLVETPAQICRAVEDALRLYPAERVFLNPDCGFATFSNRPINTSEIASAKVAAMAAAARAMRSR